MIILGIDTGYADCGYGFIESNPLKHIASGVIKTSKEHGMPVRLLEIRNDLLSLLRQYQPEVVAVEKVFFSLNAKTAMRVAEARGVILSTIAEYGNAKFVEYTPSEVKRIVTGNGSASKIWMTNAVEKKLGIEVADDNTADAIAIALTYLFQMSRNVVSVSG